MHILNQPTPEQVAEALVAAGLVEKSAGIVGHAAVFHVYQGEHWVLQVNAGKHLAAMDRTATAFQRDCPSITIPIAFSITRAATDFIGFKIPEGHMLSSVSPADAAQAIRILQEALSRTEEPSTKEAALRELEPLVAHLFTSGQSNYFEEAFPYDCALPALRDWIGQREGITTRWTNGAFLADEIILTADGPKFIGYVSARRTHFFTTNSQRDVNALLIHRVAAVKAMKRPDPALPIRLELELQARQRRIDDLEQSLSWRITAPLRRIAKWIP